MMEENPKQFKLIRTIRTAEDVTKYTARLDVLRLMLERHQNSNPDYDYAIVDEQDNPAELADFLESELAHPVAKANRVKEEKKEQYKANVVKRLKQC
jgi:nucleotidyltransferase/DNA polymerase involved in DNA repair